MNAPSFPVSVIVRSIGRETLARSLQSIAGQDYRAIEVVLVLASGTAHPPVPERCGAFPVKAVQPGRPLSRAEAAEAGIRAAGGEWLTFLDDDDAMLPDHIASLASTAARGKGERAVNGRAMMVFKDGSRHFWGQHFALSELYQRNFVSLTALLFHRSLLEQGVRFDPALEMHEDWDFALQIAHLTRFLDDPRPTFLWYADLGTSGGGAGGNIDEPKFIKFRDMIHAKWAARSEPFFARCNRELGAAAAAFNGGQLELAHKLCVEILSFSQNDPHTLNLLAMIALRRGDRDAALNCQMLAISVLPQEADFQFNLGLIFQARGDRDNARRAFGNVVALQPGHVQARNKLAELGQPAAPR
jgi:tetratricopeptide (TPR) repeat protein